MDWVTLITTLLTTLLPLIINKGPQVSKTALLRRAAGYKRISDGSSGEVALIAFEAAELCTCLAGCESQAEQEQLLATANQAFGSIARKAE